MIKRLANISKSKSFFLLGPRQTGKSTLIKTDFFESNEQSVLYIDLLKGAEFIRFSSDTSLLQKEINQNKEKIKYVIIDGVQRIPELLNDVHSILESKSSPIFILTGSSARKLKRAKANLLAGRALTYKLFPFTHLELKEQFDLHKALTIGTLPKIYLEPNKEEAQLILRSYVETYLKEEIEVEAQIRSIGKFIKFLFQAGHESGNIINFSNIAKDTNLTYHTVQEYFQILDDTLIGNFLFPFSKSKRKRLSKSPKFYIFDNGVQRALTKQLTVDLEPKTNNYGKAFEHFIINECIRLNTYLNLDYEFSYYRTESGSEVDLVIETPRGQTYGIEIKSSTNPISNEYLSGFKSIKSDIKSIKTICVCTTPRSYKENDIEILSWQDFFQRFISSL